MEQVYARILVVGEPNLNLENADELLPLAHGVVDRLQHARSGQGSQLAEFWSAHNKTVIFVTHDPRMARFATRLIQIRDGRLVSDDSNEQVSLAGAQEG